MKFEDDCKLLYKLNEKIMPEKYKKMVKSKHEQFKEALDDNANKDSKGKLGGVKVRFIFFEFLGKRRFCVFELWEHFKQYDELLAPIGGVLYPSIGV